ncbi:Vitamin B12-dependent ribonucleotide reductase [Lignipirellula cremea]|uniref:Vitamin B12-dependent ribonucleotide reductase n=1 Tax=Lignipirellula cremea TaxID=2528010 RepID=A0A518DX11_9BACT|nr:vitamin B12-dependent ribonucleotide reductase [Lignipirellula cremea]QDU96373.1 Vitamin B12-dependent ribonucleotide reductase [Lignipirellula cremea]
MSSSSESVAARRGQDRSDHNPKAGLRISTTFCPEEVNDPFDTTEWELRSAAIKDENGGILFEQHDCEIPARWSQLATNVVVSKYFYGEIGEEERESSVRQLIHRVTRTISDWGIEDGYFATAADGERFYRDLTWLCLHQHGAFNSPVWFNVGLHQQYGITGDKCTWHFDPKRQEAFQPDNPYEYPQGSACFIQSVSDNMEDIMRLASSEAMLFKFGSGTGTDLSSIRSHREKLSGGGRPSGPLSFMRVYDQIAHVVKSGGKTRRAAKMQSLKVWHPDILEFIECKHNEEKKAHALIAQGYESNFNGEAYSSVFFQNANLSVRLTDDFMHAVKKGECWKTRWITKNVSADPPEYDARQLMQRMAECAWQCGDPGVQYDTTINTWHTCPESGPINASNPCSEYMFLDNTACNLASINLMKFREPEGDFDVERFRAACRLFFIAQEIIIDHASYPTAAIAENSHKFRPLGLGYANLGSLLMTSGLPYDSPAAHGLCGSLTALLHGEGNRTSAEIAAAVGPFDGYKQNREPFNRVMGMHRDAVEQINDDGPAYLKEAARELWEEVLALGGRYGFRNAQATVLAPTGTISFLMDCDTTGIEPDIALVKYKSLAGGGMLKIINQSVRAALGQLGYSDSDIADIIKYIDENDTIEGAPHLQDEHLAVFDCAFKPANGVRSISWRAHIKMMAAAQPFLSGAISKTVNMPSESTPEDIADAYIWGWELGLKAIAIYRDGSKQSQPLSTKSEGDKAAEKEAVGKRPRRERLPDTRQSVTHKFNVAGHEGYITVGLYPDGRPGELFITMAKEGSTIGGLMDCFGTAISMSLQYGVPLEVLVNKFSHTRFEPMGHTTNPDVRIAKSVVDYIFRFMAVAFMAGYKEASNGLPPEGAKEDTTTLIAKEESSGKMTIGAPPKDPASAGEKAKKAEPAEKTEQAEKAAPSNGHNNGSNGHGKGKVAAPSQTVDTDLLERAGVMSKQDMNSDNRSEQFARFQSDAPSCDNCGAITVRNGNCYLCHNCGNSMGCS